jgi:protein involved in polysaccharide export with SLBB domain
VADSVDLALMRCGVNPDTVNAGSGDPVQRATVLQDLLSRCNTQTAPSTSSETVAEADSGFAIFGLDFFRRQTTQFEPNLTGPVDANYRFGPGDKLVLVLTGDVEQSYTLDVTREGFIVIPQVGQLYVNNLTMGQLEDLLYSRLSKVYSGVQRGAGATTQFSVSPVKLRSNLIYVTGDVLRPGAYMISSAGTVLSALYAAGGPSNNGSLRQVEVRRNGTLIGTLDLYDYLMQGDASGDIRLQNGDIIFIPVHLPRVRMVGNVTRPATYEIRPTETLADALRFAGGFTANASRQRVQIERIVPPAQRENGRDRVTTDIVSEEFAEGYGPKVAVAPGDIIRIFPVSTRVRNRIVVRGNVNQPGPQGLTPGMTLADALRKAGGVKSDTYLGRVLISRLQPDSTRIQLRAELKDTTGAVVNDFALQEDDQIHVFSQTEFRPTRYVAINGAVRKSGQYPYRDGMTVRDLILMAGGLEESALLNTAQIARLPDDRSGARTAREFDIPLDSSYIFERGPDGHYAGPPGLPAPAGPSPDVALLPYDNVLILRQPNWQLLQTVVVAGEVKFPGTYTLLSKNDRVTDVLKRAGGLTNEGYANGVTFYRHKSKIGRIGINLPDVLRNPQDRDNLLLQNGDSIFIPRYSSVVRVTGAVNSPVAVSYVPGRDLNYYIRAAGGPSATADASRAYVTQPNGKVDAKSNRFLLPNHIPEPQPGSTVYVPAHDPSYKPTDKVALTGAIAGVLSSLVAITIAISR